MCLCVYSLKLSNGSFTENENSRLPLSLPESETFYSRQFYAASRKRKAWPLMSRISTLSESGAGYVRERPGVKSRKKKRRYITPPPPPLAPVLNNQWWVRPKTDQNSVVFLIKNWERGGVNFSPKLSNTVASRSRRTWDLQVTLDWSVIFSYRSTTWSSSPHLP